MGRPRYTLRSCAEWGMHGVDPGPRQQTNERGYATAHVRAFSTRTLKTRACYYAGTCLYHQNQSPSTSVTYVQWTIDPNAPLHFTDSASPWLVRSRTPGMDQLGARPLFAVMSQPSTTSADDGKMLDIIQDGGGFEDRQVDDS